MPTIDFWLPGEFEDIYNMTTLTGIVDSVSTFNKTVDVTIGGIQYKGVNATYNPHPWIDINILLAAGIFFFKENDEVIVLNKGGKDDFLSSDLQVVGFTDKTDGYSYTLGIVLNKGDGTTLEYTGENDEEVSFIFKDGLGNEVSLPFIGAREKEIPADNPPYSFINSSSGNGGTVWHNFFSVPGSLRKYLKDHAGLEALLKYVPNDINKSFSIPISGFEQTELIHYFYRGIESFFVCATVWYPSNGSYISKDKIYRHDGFSSNIIDSFVSPHSIQNIAWDGENILSLQANVDPNIIYRHDGFSSTIIDSFSSPFSGNVGGMTWDGDNVILARTIFGEIGEGECALRFYKQSGFSGIVQTSICGGYYPWTIGEDDFVRPACNSLAYDYENDSLILLKQAGDYDPGFVLKFLGFSSTIIDTIIYGEAPANYDSPIAIGWTENDLIGIHYSGPPLYKYTLYLWNGFSFDIINSFEHPGLSPYPGTAALPRSIAWEKKKT